MRGQIYAALQGDATIQGVVGEDGVYSQYDTVPPTPFLVVRFGNAVPRVADTYRENFTIWAHDEPGDYSRIDGLLNRAKEVLEALPNTGKLFECTWFEDSSDLPVDASTGTIARYSRFQHTSRR